MQSYNGSIRSENGITNNLPAGQYASAIDAAIGSTPGIIYTGASSSNFGSGSSSSTGWVVGGGSYPEEFNFPPGNRLRTSYNYLLDNKNRGQLPSTDLNTICAGGIANCTLPANLPNGIYEANGNLFLNSYTFPAGRDYIFLISQTLRVNGPLVVPNGSSALFSSGVDIVVNRSVGAASNSLPRPAGQIQGFFSAERNFIMDGINNCSLGTDRMLNIDGAIITNAAGTGGSVINQRNLCGSNGTAPAYTVAPRLDFILNAPSFIRHQTTISKEVAP